jgi:hypothetical protein
LQAPKRGGRAPVPAKKKTVMLAVSLLEIYVVSLLGGL